jgi:hypothetical protein
MGHTKKKYLKNKLSLPGACMGRIDMSSQVPVT